MTQPEPGDHPVELQSTDVPKAVPSVGRADAAPTARDDDTRLDVAVRRIAALADRWSDSPNETPADVLSDQLRVVVQELQTLYEQLHRQTSELHDARALVDAERARYRELFEVAREGYLETDHVGAIRESNQGAATLLNLPIDYLIGKPLASYVADADRREFRTRLHRARDGMQTQECTLHLTHHALPPTLV